MRRQADNLERWGGIFRRSGVLTGQIRRKDCVGNPMVDMPRDIVTVVRFRMNVEEGKRAHP